MLRPPKLLSSPQLRALLADAPGPAASGGTTPLAAVRKSMGRLMAPEAMLGRRFAQRVSLLRRDWLPALARDPEPAAAPTEAMDQDGGRRAPSIVFYPPLVLRWLFRRPAGAAFAGGLPALGRVPRQQELPASAGKGMGVSADTLLPHLREASPLAAPAMGFAQSGLLAMPVEAEMIEQRVAPLSRLLIERLVGAQALPAVTSAPMPLAQRVTQVGLARETERAARQTVPSRLGAEQSWPGEQRSAALPASVQRTAALAQRQAADHLSSRLLVAPYAMPLVHTDDIPTEERFVAPRGATEAAWPAHEGGFAASPPVTTTGWSGAADDPVWTQQGESEGDREPLVARLAASRTSDAAPAGEEEIPPELAHLPPLLAKLIVRDQAERRNKARELPHAAPRALAEPSRATTPSSAVPDSIDTGSRTGFAFPSEPPAPRWPRPSPPNSDAEAMATRQPAPPARTAAAPGRQSAATEGDRPAGPAQQPNSWPEKAAGDEGDSPDRAGDAERTPYRQAEQLPMDPGATAAVPRAVPPRRRGVVTEVARSGEPAGTQSGQAAGEEGPADRAEPSSSQSGTERLGSMDAPADAVTTSSPARVPPMARRLPPVPPGGPSPRPLLSRLIDEAAAVLPAEARPVIAEALTLKPAALPGWGPDWARPAAVDDEGPALDGASGEPAGDAGFDRLPLPAVAMRRSRGLAEQEARSAVEIDPAWPGLGAAAPAITTSEEQYLGLLFGSIGHSSATRPELALAPINRPATTETVQTAPADAAAQATGAQEGEGAQPSLDHLAQQVYDILKHRLAVERERLGGIG